VTLGRRGFIAAAFGLLACRRRGERVAGEIAGASAARGHLLRGAAARAPAGELRCEVAIVGGGIAGLSAAWALEKHGVRDFLLFDLEDDLGGTARAGASRATAYPWGAHYVPVPTHESVAVRRLLDEVGVDERHLCHAPQERLFHAGRWEEGLFPRAGATAEDLRQLEAFRAEMARLRERRAFAIPMELSARDEELLALDRVSMRGWLAARGYTSPRLRWWTEYACRDDYGSTLARTSAWAAIHYYAAREVGDEVYTWPGGNGWIVARLRERLGKERLRTGHVALAARERELHVLDVARDRVMRVFAERVILAVPQFVCAPLLGEPQPAFEYAPWVVANVHLRSTPPSAQTERGAPLAWDNVFHGSDSLGYVVATHQRFQPAPAAGPTVWTWYRPYTGPDPRQDRERLLRTRWEELRDDALRDLRRAHPDLDRHAERIDIMIWGHGMVRPLPGLLWGEARTRAAAPRHGGTVLPAAADLSGLPLFEEAQYRGILAAEAAARALGRKFPSLLGG
jgi:phytoene dehydrogenase-like protein